jgi:hypothetical protein
MGWGGGGLYRVRTEQGSRRPRVLRGPWYDSPVESKRLCLFVIWKISGHTETSSATFAAATARWTAEPSP